MIDARSMTVESAADFIAANSVIPATFIVDSAEKYRLAYRQAAARLHPDATHSNDGFYTLGRAKERLDQHHGLATAGGAS